MKKILIVDDDLFIRDLYEELLKGPDHVVETAKDGEEGLKKINEGGYDLILLDVMMPKLDGHGLLVKLSENPPKAKNGPVIILTNLANDPVIDACLKLGAKSFYIKSDHTPEEFLAMVNKYLA